MKVFIIFAAVMLLTGRPAGATIILKMDLKQLVGRSDRIFVGKATKVHSHWTKDRRHIVTDTTFKVERSIHGIQAGQTVVVRRMGGAVNGIGMKVTGSPSFHKGDRVLLFTERRNNSRYVIGMRQGVYRVYKNNAGQSMVRARLEGLTLAKQGRSGLKMVEPQPRPSPRLLDDFVGQIKRTIAVCAKEASRCRAR